MFSEKITNKFPFNSFTPHLQNQAPSCMLSPVSRRSSSSRDISPHPARLPSPVPVPPPPLATSPLHTVAVPMTPGHKSRNVPATKQPKRRTSSSNSNTTTTSAAASTSSNSPRNPHPSNPFIAAGQHLPANGYHVNPAPPGHYLIQTQHPQPYQAQPYAQPCYYPSVQRPTVQANPFLAPSPTPTNTSSPNGLNNQFVSPSAANGGAATGAAGTAMQPASNHLLMRPQNLPLGYSDNAGSQVDIPRMRQQLLQESL